MYHRDKKGKFCTRKKYTRNLRREESIQCETASLAQEEGGGYIIDQVNVESLSWKQGRRIVELDLLARQMYCVSCGNPLHLSNIVSEKRYGLGSILYIRCSDEKCGVLSDIHTGKRSVQGGFDVNYKLTLGMIDTGMGPYQVNNLLASLNIPPVDPSTIKRKEKKLDTILENVAKESCLDAQKQEVERSGGNVEVSFDCGWQKRGTGFNYDSNTGHGSMIGRETGKVVEFALHSKSCQVCSIHANKKQTVPAHDCTITWDGTSKAMEPDMASLMMTNLEKSGCAVKVIHGDNDSTTASRLKRDFPSLVKKDDANHIKKSLTSKLYKLSSKYRELKSPPVIPYIARCFMYCIQSSQKKSSEELKDALNMIVPHLYGNHESCTQNTWCSYSRNPSNYRFKSLPDGKPLCNKDLKKELSKVVQVYQDRAESLANIGSTQSNENFNFIVSTKAPKYKSFGSSKSLLGRLSASVLQKNEGRSYIAKVNTSYGLSPGEFTTKLAQKITVKRSAAKERSGTLASKRKRVIKKMKKKKQDLVSSVHEGVTYKSHIELDEENEDYVTEIPKSATITSDDNFIIFDLETCGLGRKSEILQLAASETQSKSSLNVYMKPRCSIPVRASSINGITYNHEENELYHHGKLVDSKLVSSGLLDFLDFMKRYQSPILVGHNITNFDIPVLLNKLQEHGLAAEFSWCTKGFVDTLKLSKRVLPKASVPNFKQETLVKEFTDCSYDAHDAKEDVTALSVLFNERLLSDVRDTDLHNIKYHAVKKRYQKMVKSKCISNAVVTSLARLGIQPGHLRLALSRDHRGIQLLLRNLNIKCKTVSAIIKHIEKEE